MPTAKALIDLNDEGPDDPGGPVHSAPGRATMRLRSAGLAVLLAALALGLAACGGTGSGSPPVANVSTTTSVSTHGAAGAARTVHKNDAAQSLIHWASCMRSHGDPDQADPTIDSHGVISVTIPTDAQSLSGAVHNGTAPCNNYLAAASAALRAGRNLTPPDQAALVQYSQCMRANGEPNYPDPGTGGRTDLKGIDLNSPFFQRANDICGKKIHAPSWWITGTGPPGDIVVTSGGIPPGGRGAIEPPSPSTVHG